MKRIECFSFTFNAALDECTAWPFDVSVFRKLLLAVVHTTPTSRCFLYPGDHFRKVPFSKSFTLHHLGNVAMFLFWTEGLIVKFIRISVLTGPE